MGVSLVTEGLLPDLQRMAFGGGIEVSLSQTNWDNGPTIRHERSGTDSSAR